MNLNQLINETSSIKDNIIKSHSDLKKILIEKNVNVLNEDKFSILINKIMDIRSKSNLPKWYDPFGQDIWFYKTINLPTKNVYSPGVVNIGKKIYYIGGGEDGNIYYTNKTFCYDIDKDKWSELRSAPASIKSFGICTDGKNKIYCIGGNEFSSGSTISRLNDLYCYNIDTNSWQNLAKMPKKLEGIKSAFIDNKIYCFFGEDESYIDNKNIYCYDVLTNTWSTKIPTNYNLRYPGFVSNDKDIYIIGGQAGKSVTDTVFKYNTLSNTIMTLAKLPMRRQGIGCCVYQGKIYCVGGNVFYNESDDEDSFGDGNARSYYNIQSNTWKTQPNIEARFHNPYLLNIDNIIYRISGKRMDGNTDEGIATIDIYIP